jgi:TetR/AcrR family transcriptional regulator of autoinduction and epiphytic fitness
VTLQPLDEPVKRSYSSPRREQQAQETKQAILEAAIALFTKLGFHDTSVKQIAEHASVSEQTVYNAFGDKVGVLVGAGLLYIESSGPAEDAAFIEILRAQPDPIQRIRMVAQDSRQTWESGALQLELMAFNDQIRDPRLQDLAERGLEYKRASAERVSRAVFPDSIRRPDIAIDDIVALAMAVDSASTVSTMLRLGWTMDQWQEWLERILLIFLKEDQTTPKPEIPITPTSPKRHSQDAP